jgi:ribosomal protein S18 acetylase RimI-like enzyme
LNAALQCAESRAEVFRVILTVTEGNEAAVNLYRSAGFEAFGTEGMAIRTPEGYRAKVHMGKTFLRKLAEAGGAAHGPLGASSLERQSRT